MKLNDDYTKRVKVILLIPNLGRGGAQQVFRQQLNSLSTNFEVKGCVFNWEGAFQEDRIDNIVSLDVQAGRTILGKILNFILRIRKLRRLKKKLGVHVTISHLEGADYINVLSKAGDKTICWIHGTKKHDENIEGKLGVIRRRLMIPFFYKRANRIVTVSNGITDELATDYPTLKAKLLTIYNGFDVERILNQSNEQVEENLSAIFNHSKILITHCRLSRQKNLKALFQIFNNLSKTEKKKLVIVGDGELRQELLLFCNDIGLNYWAVWENRPIHDSADVYFIGQQPNPFKYLSKASIYIMTSGWEGFPLALCEALACGLPIITTDCFTGPREIIAPEIEVTQPVEEPYHTQYGILMPLINLNDPLVLSIWVNEVNKILTSHDLSLSRMAGVHRIREFELSKSMDQTGILIQEIMS
jgi:glycosyltransferase involved in cell wall biosynthesis